MNQKLLRKKETELTYGSYFITWVNKKYSCDYCAVFNEQDDSDIDVFGVSSNKEKLNLQMVTSNGETFKLAKRNSKKIATGEEFGVIPVDLDGWLKKAIADKNKKHYSKPEELIIIIEGFLPTPNPKEVRDTLIVNERIKYKGAYFVSLPVISSTNLDYEKRGDVITIKSALDSI